ncbi:MAG: phosphonate metabolism protein/1,5-bisphosphokinase (PRPP-forming) PhnN [Rhizobiaceae bacterium]|nr:phosphonate metabolism protein/1,5-bisphosphokinase (PRPP-forming) PhnN [Rhizobiaceae bacterium]
MMPTSPIGGGSFIAVVGPSGAGKDSVMRFAREALADDPRVHFIRRVITRPHDEVGEDHQPADDATFDAMRDDGRFALNWQAHGNSYGIPVAADAMVAQGHVVIANLSRTVLADLPRRYRRPLVVEITAAPEILARRIAMRGRESEAEIANRLARKVAAEPFPGTVVIDNGGRLEDAGRAFADLIGRELP